MNKILKDIDDNITQIYLQMFFEELDALSKELEISSLELMMNFVSQDYITMKELNKLIEKNNNENKRTTTKES